ncbi:MAG: YdeI/OmpD-associated family protein [Pseudomonadota bacterium]
MADAEQLEITSAGDLWEWLDARHGQSESVWLVTFKKATPEKFVSREEVLDALVAYGWIDGRRKKLDDERTMQLIAPRQQQAWAKTYQERATRLEAEGRMQPPGRAAIAAAKKAGTFDDLQDVDALQVPADLREALDHRPAAAKFFDNAAPSYRRNVLRWIAIAKRSETREKRIRLLTDASAENEKVPQF